MGLDPSSWFADWFNWMPVEGSPWSGKVDWLNSFITLVAAFCTIAVTLQMLYFAVKYRRRGPNDQTAYITHNATLETVWTVIPTLVCIFVFIVGFRYYHEMRTPPANSLEVSVTGRKWVWSYKYPNGKTSDGDLVVPINRPVKLILRSEDVNHSFFIPAMRVKEDVIRGEYHYLWFTPTVAGKHQIFCAEYCGDDHSAMLGNLLVVSEQEYQDYVSSRVVVTDSGDQLYVKKGCKGCHSLDGSKMTGPSFKGLFGKSESLTDGSTVTVDENYLSTSIRNPMQQVVAGYPPVMPPIAASDAEVDALVQFVKSQK